MRLKKQRHGTIAIISNCNSVKDITNESTEIGKFCKMNRAIALDTPISYTEEEKILSYTNVDGALFMDFDGNCFAFSVLLDGVAKVKEDVFCKESSEEKYDLYRSL